ncbi:NADP-dependent oxidoreductase domain-containing protein [Amylostereum chailletii]|nr:NADP-dependent oxidoreductase domain-containing protein [Amylostereum chailletii]
MTKFLPYFILMIVLIPRLSTRKIGTTPISAIGFGVMGLSLNYAAAPSDEERTARKEIFLATKFGLGDSTHMPNGTPEHTTQQIANSLKRLQTDYIDLWYLHWCIPSLRCKGKVQYLGVSEVSATSLRRANAVHPISAIELEYSASEIGIESEEIGVLKVARELGITVVAYSPLGRGLFTGQVKKHEDLAAHDFRRAIPCFSPENFPNYLQLADSLSEIGKAYGATAGQVALAWLLAQGDDIVPIPGTKKVKFLDENLGPLMVNLSQEELIKIRALATKADSAFFGDRQPAFLAAVAYGDTPELI